MNKKINWKDRVEYLEGLPIRMANQSVYDWGFKCIERCRVGNWCLHHKEGVGIIYVMQEKQIVTEAEFRL